MTNEELAQLIKQGEKGHILTLWGQVERLLEMLCGRAYRQLKGRADHAGAALEDFRQESYLAFLEAIEAFDPSSGYKFTAYLKYPLKNRICSLLRLRTERGRNDPLCNCASLEAQREDGELPLAETIPTDDDLEGDTLEKVWNEQLSRALGQCLEELPPPLSRVLVAKYYDEKSLEEIGKEAGETPQWVRKAHGQGLQALRKGRNRARLLPYAESILGTYAYRGTGFAPFLLTGISSVERAVERQEEASQQWKSHDNTR